MPRSSAMTTGAWPHGGRPDHLPGAPDGIGSQTGAVTGRLGVWTATRARNGRPQHLSAIGPGQPDQVRPVTGSAAAWLRIHNPPGCRDAGHSRRDPGRPPLPLMREMRTVGREHPALPCGRAAIRLAGRDKPARGERCDGASLAWAGTGTSNACRVLCRFGTVWRRSVLECRYINALWRGSSNCPDRGRS
jgi:hypothetical protein